MKYSFYLQILLFGIIAFSCSKGPTNTKQDQINKNIILIKNCCKVGELHGDFHMGIVSDNRIYFVGAGIGYFDITKGFQVVSDSVFMPENIDSLHGHYKLTYISSLDTDQNFLLVLSLYGDISNGALYEYNTASNRIVLLRDTTYNISSAIYWHGDDNKLVYYSYGKDKGLQAGYYLYNKTTNKDSLLLVYESPAGSSEMLNGFDLSPDNTRLLIPLVQATPLTIHPPLVGIYDLQTQMMDTLNVHFDQSFDREGLWLRYSSDGSKILYCNFPHGAYSYTTNDDSQVGIIEMPSQTKRVLNVNTYTGGRSVQLAPTWGSNDQNIVYGSAPLAMPSGAKGTYSLYVLKNVNDPDNYINP